MNYFQGIRVVILLLYVPIYLLSYRSANITTRYAVAAKLLLDASRVCPLYQPPRPGIDPRVIMFEALSHQKPKDREAPTFKS